MQLLNQDCKFLILIFSNRDFPPCYTGQHHRTTDNCPNCPMDDFRMYYENFRSQLKLRLTGHRTLHKTCPNCPVSDENPSDIFIVGAEAETG